MASPTKVALVTAASAGLGAACAKALAPYFRVVVNYHSRAQAADDLIQEIDEIAPEYTLGNGELRSCAIQGDIFCRDQIHRVVEETVHKMRRLDVVISNGGWTRVTDFYDIEQQTDEHDWDKCFNANVKSHLWLFHAARPHLAQSRGAFISVASLAGVRPSGSSLPYGVTKAAQIFLVESLAAICEKDNIRCNSVCPGLMLTEWGRRFTDQQIQKWTEMTALKKLVEVDDVAEQIRSLSLNQSMTGQKIIIDCGFGL